MIAAIGLGSNVGDRIANVRTAIAALGAAGNVRAQSRLYESKPWGKTDQPNFVNAAVLLETDLRPHALLEVLKKIERRLGRVDGERWGPRTIDLDILTYGDLQLEDSDLTIPHRALFERAFALIPLAEIDDRFAQAAQKMRLTGADEALRPMPEELTGRVRSLVAAFLETDLVRLRIEDANADYVEFERSGHSMSSRTERSESRPQRNGEREKAQRTTDPVKADLVGIVHFSRPAPKVGDLLNGDRELAYVEALGIRNPVRSLGGGRLVAIEIRDGQPVEYGQVLFQIDRAIAG